MVMEASRTALYPKPSIQPGKPAKQPSPPKFSGAIDGFSNLVGAIDSNRLAELMVSDVVGMVLPRSVMAFKERGVDDGRETFLREFSGLIGNVLITGWLGYGMLKLLGNRVNGYNPHGLALDAHINASNLDAFSKLYHSALNETKNPEEARAQFIKKFMAGLESSNSQFMAPAQLEALNKLSPDQHPGMIKTLLSKAFDDREVEKHLTAIKDKSGEKKNEYLEKVLKERNGKLSGTSQKELAQFFQPRSNALNSTLGPDAGTLSLDEKAEAKIKSWMEKSPNSNYGEKLAQDKEFRRKETLKARLRIYQDSTKATEDFVKQVDEQALRRGVTGTINLKDGEKMLAEGQSRKNTLQELKYFLEHFVDRATFEAKQKSPTDIKEQLQHVQETLFRKADKGFLHQLLPKADDGLLTAVIKHKTMLTAIPIALAVGAAGAFTFYNQYITAQKHGGKMFFPGEGGSFASPNKTGPLVPQNQNIPLSRNFKPFMGFQQARGDDGGILA